MNILIEQELECPYCGEPTLVTVDTAQGDYSTIEDCSVCCRPIEFSFRCRPGMVEQADAAQGD